MSTHMNGTNGVQNGTAHRNGIHSKHGARKAQVFQESFLIRILLPITLIFLTPNFTLWLWYTIRFHGGSYQSFGLALFDSPLTVLTDVWAKVNIGTPFCLGVIGCYMLFQAVLMKIIPGPTAKGPVTPNGNVPVYVDNGFRIYLITMASFAALSYYLKTYTPYSPSLVYDHFGDLLGTMNVFSVIFCFFLYLKGLFMPSTSDSGSSGNPLFDYYWGTELYPRIFGIDVKVFTNCRFGCTVWALIPCCFAMKAYELHGFDAAINSFVSLAILLVYLTKFFWWEAGYMCTIDIILDRAGFYICWGCLCYIPGLYTVFSLYLVSHPIALGHFHAAAILVAGLVCVGVNYLADWQRQDVRSRDGATTVWGRRPEIIRAKYTTSTGAEKESILLVSGFWGLARHFHYLPELGLAFCWTMPCGFEHVIPYSYFLFLCILLVHRTFRDDIKCSDKYGRYWEQYKLKVPYRIVPFIF